MLSATLHTNLRTRSIRGERSTPGRDRAARSRTGITVDLLDPHDLVVSTLTLKPDVVGGVTGLFWNLAQHTNRVTRRSGWLWTKSWRDFAVKVLPAEQVRSQRLHYSSGRCCDKRAGHDLYGSACFGPDGQPASGAVVTATMRIAGDAWASLPVNATTDVDGHATVTLPVPGWSASQGYRACLDAQRPVDENDGSGQ